MNVTERIGFDPQTNLVIPPSTRMARAPYRTGRLTLRIARRAETASTEPKTRIQRRKSTTMPTWLFTSLRGYRLGWLPGDLIAGLMLAAIAIPGQLATARLARMSPEAGLYAFAAGSIAFAAFGANRFMSVAADWTIAPIFAGGLRRSPRPGQRTMPGWPRCSLSWSGSSSSSSGFSGPAGLPHCCRSR